MDHAQFGCVVQPEELAVTLTRQQDGLKLDCVQFGCIVQPEELAVMLTQQGGLYLDSGWTTSGEQDTGNNRGNSTLAHLFSN